MVVVASNKTNNQIDNGKKVDLLVVVKTILYKRTIRLI